MKKIAFLAALWLLAAQSNYTTAQSANQQSVNYQPANHPSVNQGTLVTDSLLSTVLKDNKIYLDPLRKIYIYLPASYATSKHAYPVVFYFHTMFSNAPALLEASGMKQLLDRAFSSGLSKEFILVVPDCSSPTLGSLYENSSTSGRWLDYITEELLPYIDSHYQTLPKKESRALTGDFMGGRGAFKLAMTRPDLFSLVYALHPVATGMGYIPWVNSDINWERIHQAKTYDELEGLGFSKIFLGIQQAFLPDPDRPPFFCDFMIDIENGERKINTANMKKVKDSFLLDHGLEHYKDNLTRLKAIAFDWGRFDPVQEHVVSAANLSRQLQDLGIRHEAEEYAGIPWQNNWTETGRFYTRVIPFLARNLEFSPKLVGH